MHPDSHIFVVDDEPSMLRCTQQLLEVEHHRVSTFTNGAEAIARITGGMKPDLVLLDVGMPEIDGLETLRRLREVQPGINVIMLSCITDTRKVVQAMQLGARDYLTKPFKKADLDSALQMIAKKPQKSTGQVGQVGSPVSVEELDENNFFLAASPSTKQLRVQASLLANVNVPVLVLGESGTGKEVIARLIHKMSSRAHRTLMKVNCAAVPDDLLESELFGYEQGAFTGATRQKPGKFELCNHGTMLLDEIGEMSNGLQAKLLHVLQDGEFSRLGSRSVIKVDVRVIAATNIDMPSAIAANRFREDLYYRLNTFTLHVKPLRERREEIPLLIKQLVTRFSERFGRPAPSLSPALQDACLEYAWPGNVRELGNFVKRFIILGDEDAALAELLAGTKLTGADASAKVAKTSDLKKIVRSVKDEAEIQAITVTLEQTNWNRKEAALLLNISYKALLYKIRQYGIEPTRPVRRMGLSAQA